MQQMSLDCNLLGWRYSFCVEFFWARYSITFLQAAIRTVYAMYFKLIKLIWTNFLYNLLPLIIRLKDMDVEQYIVSSNLDMFYD